VAPPPQGLVVAPVSVNVAEGGQSAFTVKLAQQPAAEVVVTIARQSGDTDLSANATMLTFAPANWDTPQAVAVLAAQDADTANGSAVFSVAASGLTTQSVTATEQDDDAPAAPIVRRPTADSYGRDGTYATQNFGSSGELQLKKGAAGSNREAFLKFNLADLSAIGSAKLRIYGRIDSSTDQPVVSVYASGNTGWAENTVNWNTRPLAGAEPLAQVTLSPGMTAARYYEFDVTDFLRQEQQGERLNVTLVLKVETATTPYLIFASDEAAANRPELVVTPADPAGTPQAIVVSRDFFPVNEGASETFTVKLAKAPTADVVVTVARQAGGDEDLSAAPAELTFTPANWDQPQTVTVNAADDADTTSGAAVFTLTATGLPTKTINVTEIDDDVPAGPVEIRSSDDAYVRDGTAAGQNFGGASELQLKKNATGANREIWLKFDLTQAWTIGSATLRVFGRIDSSTETPSVAAYAADSAWTESSLTWNTRPTASTTALATTTVATAVQKWYEWDVTSFLAAEKAAGRNVVTLVLRSLTTTTPHMIFASDEAAANQPQLRITP
jgi:hypothetical protein